MLQGVLSVSNVICKKSVTNSSEKEKLTWCSFRPRFFFALLLIPGNDRKTQKFRVEKARPHNMLVSRKAGRVLCKFIFIKYIMVLRSFFSIFSKDSVFG